MVAHVADELALLRTHRNESGYLNVYRKCRAPDGTTHWHSKVKQGRRLVTLPGSRSPDVRRVARRVLDWYKVTFGPDRWREALRLRRRNPTKVRHSKELGGYHCAVWVCGRRREVLHVSKSGVIITADRPAIFPTREAARAGLIAFAEAVTGHAWRGNPHLWRA